MHNLFQSLASGRTLSLLDYTPTTLGTVRAILPSPMGGSQSWSAIGYAAWRVLSRRKGEGVLRSSVLGALLPPGVPSTWGDHDGIPSGWNLRGLLLLAACQVPTLFDSNGPGQGTTVNHLWVSDLNATIQMDRRALIEDALQTARHLWAAPRFTDLQRDLLARSVVHQLLRWAKEDGPWVAQALAQDWPPGDRWGQVWSQLARGYPILTAMGRAHQVEELTPKNSRPRLRS